MYLHKEEDVIIFNSKRKCYFEHTNKESNGNSSEEEEIKLPKCGRKGEAKNLNEKTKENISEYEEIVIRKCRRKSRIDILNEKVRRWTSSSKIQECPPERTKTKEENRLEDKKRKLKQAALEWDDLDIQAELKSFMYVDRSLRGDAKKEKLIDELNFKKCMQLKIILKSKIFVGSTNKQIKYIIHPEFMVANQEITDQFIQNLKVTQTRFMT